MVTLAPTLCFVHHTMHVGPLNLCWWNQATLVPLHSPAKALGLIYVTKQAHATLGKPIQAHSRPTKTCAWKNSSGATSPFLEIEAKNALQVFCGAPKGVTRNSSFLWSRFMVELVEWSSHSTLVQAAKSGSAGFHGVDLPKRIISSSELQIKLSIYEF